MLCIKNSTWKSFSGNEKKDESASGIKRNTISRPTAYGEYAPYTFIENEEEFEKLVEKMNLYKDFYENFQPGDSGFASIPQLIFVCEDEKHMAECFREIVTNKVEIPQIKLLFTTDLRQNKETLDETLVEFKLVDGKYKMEDVELKLLG